VSGPADELYTTFAAIYDAAFDWDVGDQVTAISSLSGLEGGRVLEPMCGSGRLLRGFASAGFATVGIDNSPQMLSLAQANFDRAALTGEWLQADVTDFDLDQACDLAVCPINSLAHLASEAAMESHLAAVSRNLTSGACYWVQLDLKLPHQIGQAETWEFEYLGQTLTSEWACTGSHDGYETHASRIVFPDGHHIEASYEMKLWDYQHWKDLLARTSFSLSAAWRDNDFTPLPNDSSLNGERVFWQQLTKLH
jgi:SAM-dependent methyltransferase